MSKQNIVKIFSILAVLCAFAVDPAFSQKKKHDRKTEWKKHVGKPGPDGWRVNVIQPDPHDDGPDGFTCTSTLARKRYVDSGPTSSSSKNTESARTPGSETSIRMATSITSPTADTSSSTREGRT